MPKCPYCGEEMEEVETSPESTWGGEIHHVCFNNACSYYRKSFEAIGKTGHKRIGYRCERYPNGNYGCYLVWDPEAAVDFAYLSSSGPRE